MKRFLVEANNLTNPKARRIIKGLTIYAQGIYDLMRDNEISEYKKIVRELNSFLFKMDQKYYSELEGKQGGMKKLVSYLNGQSIPQ